jgi:hypothetical protein
MTTEKAHGHTAKSSVKAIAPVRPSGWPHRCNVNQLSTQHRQVKSRDFQALKLANRDQMRPQFLIAIRESKIQWNYQICISQFL